MSMFNSYVKLLEGNIHIEYMILVGGLEHFFVQYIGKNNAN